MVRQYRFHKQKFITFVSSQTDEHCQHLLPCSVVVTRTAVIFLTAVTSREFGCHVRIYDVDVQHSDAEMDNGELEIEKLVDGRVAGHLGAAGV